MMEKELRNLEALYEDMDKAYEGFARDYGFTCSGCEENCCSQRFHHHTLAEYLYLLDGLKQAAPELRERIIMRARMVVESYAHELQAGEMFKLMCPANFDGLCALYDWRPMMCRLHGLPHRFTMPDGTEKTGEGCHRFRQAQSLKGGETAALDRTPFYQRLAGIEKSLREGLGFRERIKKTTAQMLMEMSLELDFEEM